MTSMKALVLKEYGKFSHEDVPRPAIGRDEVLVAVKACGICGSDVHGMDGSTGRRRPPLIMGHEAAGTVAETGEAVKHFKRGQRVTFDSTIYCGQCEFCRRGEINLCQGRRVLGVSCEDYSRDGAFAEFVAVPERVLHPLPDALTFEQAALVEPFAIALHAVGRAQVLSSERTVVIGCGMIGLALIQVLRARGCANIVALDVAADKLATARKCGATTALAADGAALEKILGLTEGAGADVVLEAVGLPATVELAVRAARKGGRVVLVGNVTPTVELPLQWTVTRELTLFGSCASAGEYPECLALMERGAIDPAPLISAVAPLHEGAAWFDRLYRREPGLLKVVLTP
jgi:L-iditol 2-dehydrogenase